AVDGGGEALQRRNNRAFYPSQWLVGGGDVAAVACGGSVAACGRGCTVTAVRALKGDGKGSRGTTMSVVADGTDSRKCGVGVWIHVHRVVGCRLTGGREQ